MNRQLEARNISIEEYHRLSDAKINYEEAFRRYIRGDEAAEADVTKWSNVIDAHPERIKEIERQDREWAAAEMPRCNEAFELTRSFVPVDVVSKSVDDLVASGLPRALATRIVQKKQLWLVVMHPDDVARLHPAELNNKYAVVGCDIVELRSIFSVLPAAFPNDPSGEKMAWRSGVLEKLKEMTAKEKNSQLSPNEARHSAYPNGTGPFDPRASIIRNEAVRSTAFERTPQPVDMMPRDGNGSSRVEDLRAVLLAQQGQSNAGAAE